MTDQTAQHPAERTPKTPETESPQPEGDEISPMEYVKANGFIDFPHAWVISRRTTPEYHHNECSFNTTGGVILCDCEVLTKSPEYVLAYGTPASTTEAQR